VPLPAPVVVLRQLSVPLGLEGLQKIRKMVRTPLVAIGGIHCGNAKEVVCAGANGLAVVSAIVSADFPKEAAAAIRKEIVNALMLPQLPQR